MLASLADLEAQQSRIREQARFGSIDGPPTFASSFQFGEADTGPIDVRLTDRCRQMTSASPAWFPWSSILWTTARRCRTLSVAQGRIRCLAGVITFLASDGARAVNVAPVTVTYLV